MEKYDNIYNKNLVDAVNEQINIGKLWDALYDYNPPTICIWFTYIDGTNSIHKCEKYCKDTIYFTDGISIDITHDRLLNIKFNHKEMVFDSLDTLKVLNSIFMVNVFKPAEYIFRLDIQNYIPIQGTKIINWSYYGKCN